jgi:hypothetical protein
MKETSPEPVVSSSDIRPRCVKAIHLAIDKLLIDWRAAREENLTMDGVAFVSPITFTSHDRGS